MYHNQTGSGLSWLGSQPLVRDLTLVRFIKVTFNPLSTGATVYR